MERTSERSVRRGGATLRLSIVAFSLAHGLSGCALDSSQRAEAVEGDRRFLAVDPDWVGYDLGLNPPELVKVGTIEFTPPGTPWGPPPPGPDDVDPDFEPSMDEVLGFDAEGNLFEISFPKEDEAKLLAELKRLGIDGRALPPESADGGAPPPETFLPDELGMDLVVEKGLPNLVDNRVLWNMGSNGGTGTGFPQSTQGRFQTSTGSCSATLFDDRLIVFAAHCWFTYNANGSPGPGTWGTNPTFAAGKKSATSTPYGVLGPDPALTGWIYDAFVQNNCHRVYDTGICPPLDISWMALSQTPRDYYGTTAGAMGFSKNVPDDDTFYLSGYPVCGIDAPSQCPDTLYYAKLTGTCSSTSQTTKKFKTNCAGSFGQSGGPFFRYVSPPTDPRLSGVFAGQTCFGSSCSGVSSPNIMHRITTSDYDKMLEWRSMF